MRSSPKVPKYSPYMVWWSQLKRLQDARRIWGKLVMWGQFKRLQEALGSYLRLNPNRGRNIIIVNRYINIADVLAVHGWSTIICLRGAGPDSGVTILKLYLSTSIFSQYDFRIDLRFHWGWRDGMGNGHESQGEAPPSQQADRLRGF